MVQRAGVAIGRQRVDGFQRCWHRWGAWVAVPVVMFFLGGMARAADAPLLQEHALKALYLFNFTKYVEWPERGQADTNAFVIGVVGSPDVEASLKEATQGKQVGGRPVVIRRFEGESDPRVCRILYFGTSDRSPAEKMLEALRTLPVLTVGEGEAFLDRGGMVGFVRKDKKIRLFIGLETARRAGLHVSAKLLAVAEEVRDGKSR